MLPGSSHMPEPSIDWLQEAVDGRLEINGVNVWKAMRYRGYIQVIDKDGKVMDSVTGHAIVRGQSVTSSDNKTRNSIPMLERCAEFRVTDRGRKLLEDAKNAQLPFKKSDLPKTHELWLSTLRRCCRNVPKGLHLTHKDGELHVLATGLDGKVVNDSAHCLASFKVPWQEE